MSRRIWYLAMSLDTPIPVASDVTFTSPTGSKDFGIKFRWKSPFFVIQIDLALEMGWFKRKNPPASDPRFDLELGPNLVVELRDEVLPTPPDLKYR